MTDLRLQTRMYEDINFCPFCGKKLINEGNMKRCGGFHFMVEYDEEIDKVI